VTKNDAGVALVAERFRVKLHSPPQARNFLGRQA
jgi:hypothetical protein